MYDKFIGKTLINLSLGIKGSNYCCPRIGKFCFVVQILEFVWVYLTILWGWPLKGYNSRTSDNIDMKLRAVTKFDKKNKTTSRKIDDDLMSANCDVIVIFPISGQFGAIRKPDFGRIVCKSYIFIKSNLLFYKN